MARQVRAEESRIRIQIDVAWVMRAARKIRAAVIGHVKVDRLARANSGHCRQKHQQRFTGGVAQDHFAFRKVWVRAGAFDAQQHGRLVEFRQRGIKRETFGVGHGGRVDACLNRKRAWRRRHHKRVHIIVDELPRRHDGHRILKVVSMGINLVDRLLPQADGINTKWFGREQSGIGHHHAADLGQLGKVIARIH